MEAPSVNGYIASRRDNETRSFLYFLTVKRYSALNSLFMFLSPLYFLFSLAFLPGNFVFAFSSVAIYWLILLLFYHRRFTIERNYRKLNVGYLASFGKLPISYSYLKFGIFTMAVFVAVLIPINFALNWFEGVILLQSFFVILWYLMVSNLWLKNSSKRAQSIDSNDLLAKLDSITSAENMPHVVPLLIPTSDSKVANAYCAGVLKNTVYITDYLYNNLNVDQSACILAHELGHMKHKDNLLSFFLSMVPFGIVEILVLVVILIGYGLLKLPPAQFFSPPFLIALSVSIFFSVPIIIANARRKREFEADKFASKYCDPDHLAIALIKASDLNMVPISSQVGSHPSVKRRIDRMLSG
ncbi:MAG: M48 family metallopeptidase [Candidatus Thermoplasmatota archaeon]|jgi:Zn-dependent protease with chaperone function|nr:M48 family metallopeptidase [Candidatus Thermoplasmatota archaeon]